MAGGGSEKGTAVRDWPTGPLGMYRLPASQEKEEAQTGSVEFFAFFLGSRSESV